MLQLKFRLLEKDSDGLGELSVPFPNVDTILCLILGSTWRFIFAKMLVMEARVEERGGPFPVSEGSWYSLGCPWPLWVHLMTKDLPITFPGKSGVRTLKSHLLWKVLEWIKDLWPILSTSFTALERCAIPSGGTSAGVGVTFEWGILGIEVTEHQGHCSRWGWHWAGPSGGQSLFFKPQSACEGCGVQSRGGGWSREKTEERILILQSWEHMWLLPFLPIMGWEDADSALSALVDATFLKL